MCLTFVKPVLLKAYISIIICLRVHFNYDMITTIMSGTFVLINSTLKMLKGASSIHRPGCAPAMHRGALAPTSGSRTRLLQPSKRSGGSCAGGEGALLF